MLFVLYLVGILEDWIEVGIDRIQYSADSSPALWLVEVDAEREAAEAVDVAELPAVGRVRRRVQLGHDAHPAKQRVLHQLGHVGWL